MGSLVGRTLAHFRIDAELGAGGMGVVYRATDEGLRRPVALKVLPDSFARDEERSRRFLREARAAAAVMHHNIATVFEVGEADGHVFIAMELVDGETLRARIERGVSIAESLRIGKEIARGLSRAHQKGIVHRDLKPENVMITHGGEVKILDFGLAKLRDEEVANASALGEADTRSNLTQDGHVLGTPAYMSPEQARGESVDARTDVFSFGVLFFEMLTGERPFGGSTALARVLAASLDTPKRASDVNPLVPLEMDRLLERCLAKKAEDRCASGQDLLDTLDTMQAAAPGASSRRSVSAEVSPRAFDSKPTAASSTRAAPRARRRAVLVAGAVAVMLAAAAMVIARIRHEPGRGDTAASPSASAVPAATARGVAMTEHPPPRTTNEDAAAHYASALSRLRVGALQSKGQFEKAVELDSGFAAAHLRLALLGPWYRISVADTRARLAKATELEGALDARDRSLLFVAAALSADPVDYDIVVSRLRNVAERFPADAEVALLLTIYLRSLPAATHDEIEAAYARVMELDPGCTQVLKMRAEDALDTDKLEEAIGLVDECVARAPKASWCREVRVWLLGVQGDCKAELSEARELVASEPDVSLPYALLAQALAATGEPVDSVRTALDQHGARVSVSTKFPKGLSELRLALLLGDLSRAAELASSMEPALAKSSSEDDHRLLASLRIAIAEETGDRVKALLIAEGFERQSSAWVRDAPLEVHLKRLYLLHEARKLSDEAFRAEVDRLYQDSTARAASACKWSSWLQVATYFRFAETPLEATVALAHEGATTHASAAVTFTCVDFDAPLAVGRTLLLAGHTDEAIDRLRKRARQCDALPTPVSGAVYEATLDFVHAHILLGEALEAKRDIGGACEAYRVVLEQWKNARPRSVSLEKAKERVKALACPP